MEWVLQQNNISTLRCSAPSRGMLEPLHFTPLPLPLTPACSLVVVVQVEAVLVILLLLCGRGGGVSDCVREGVRVQGRVTSEKVLCYAGDF